MTYHEMNEMDAPLHGRLFCERGAKPTRDSIKTVDPILFDKDKNLYDPSNGFGVWFEEPHSQIKMSVSPDGKPLAKYNNYVTVRDINLIFYIASLGTILPTIGFQYLWNEHLAEAVNGYPWGAIVGDGNGNKYISVKNDNKDPIVDGSLSWLKCRNNSWFNFSNHVQSNGDGENRQFTSQCHSRYVPMHGGGLLGGHTPVIIYRLHSVRTTVAPVVVHTWFQAYKYWINNGTLYTKINGSFLPLQADISAFDSTDDGKKVKPGPLKYIQYYYGRKGAYLIHWIDGNPFSTVYPTDANYKVQEASVSDYELALDASMYGYGDMDMFVKPEFEEENPTLEHELTEWDVSALSGYVRLGGEADYQKVESSESQEDPSDDNMSMTSFLGTILPQFGEMVMGDSRISTHVATTSDTTPLSSSLPPPITVDIPVSFNNPNTPAQHPERNGANHYKLSSDPAIIRRGVEVELVLRKKTGSSSFEDIPIQTLYRNMWSELAIRRIERTTVNSKYSLFGVTILPDTVDRVYSSWQNDGPISLPAFLPKSFIPSTDKLVLVARFKNIQISRRFATMTEGSPRFTIPDSFYDAQYGMYYPGTGEDRFRTYFSLRSNPFELLPNALTRESFFVPPMEW